MIPLTISLRAPLTIPLMVPLTISLPVSLHDFPQGSPHDSPHGSRPARAVPEAEAARAPEAPPAPSRQRRHLGLGREGAAAAAARPACSAAIAARPPLPACLPPSAAGRRGRPGPGGRGEMSSSSNKRAPTTATQRLKQDYLRIKKDPVPYICAEPLPSNILEWHYVVRGPELTPYEGGYYHGKLIFPREFPFKPPSIYMITPNGRFKCNTRLCLSITDFHPDTWNPAWSVSTILTGLLSFMVEKGPTLGSIETSEFTKRQLAAQSLAFNLKDKVFCELFPEVVEEMKQKQKAQDELSSRPPSLPLPDVVPDGDAHFGHNGHPLLQGQHAALAPGHAGGLQQPPRNHGLLGGALANLFVIVGFAAFAYTVKYVLRSIAQE
uniref:Ubiquitin-conjugating enzyme E2 J2 n=2 Tax=Passerellidae TaxID=1729112 RepID=A0A8C5IQH7_JUNHY